MIRTNRRELLLGGAAAGLALATPGLVRAQQRSVTYVGWSQDEAASKPVLTENFNAFSAANPSIKLDVIGYPFAQVQQSLILRMRSNQPVDVAQWAERWLPQFVQVGKPADLHQVFGKEFLESQIEPGLLKLGQWEGKQYGLPWTAASIGMVANKKVMADAGLKEMPVTIDQFLQALRAIKRSNAEIVPYALTTKNNNSLSPDFQVWLWTFGGRLLDEKGNVLVNSDAGRQALSFMADLVKEGLAARDVDRPDGRRLFGQNRTGFYNDAPVARGFARDNSGQGKAFDANVSAAATPVLKAGDPPRSLAWGQLLIFPGAPKLDRESPATKFASHLALNDESQLRYFNAVGLFPVTKSAFAKIKDDAYANEWSRYAGTAETDEPSKWPNLADIVNIVGEEVQAALLQSKPANQAITDMATRLERTMRDVKKG